MSGNNLFTIKFSRKVRRSIHAILQQIAAFLIVIALISIVMHKIQNSSPHFVTAHSLLGLSTIVFVFIAMIGGGFARINFQLREYVRPIITKSLHALLGMITFTLGVITLCFGITSQWFADHSGLALQRTLVGFVTFTSIYVVYKSVVNWVDRVERAMQRS